MSVKDTITVIGLLLMGARGIWILPQIWRNERGLDPNVEPLIWPLGLAWWQGSVRVLPVFFPSLLIIAPDHVLETLRLAGPVWIALRVVLDVGVLLIACLWVGILFFNRPKWAVAPHLRHQPGMLAQWAGRRPESTATPAHEAPWQQRNRRYPR